MADSLAKHGLYIDDLCKIRILEPEVANESDKLRVECQDFVSSKLGLCFDTKKKTNSHKMHVYFFCDGTSIIEEVSNGHL